MRADEALMRRSAAGDPDAAAALFDDATASYVHMLCILVRKLGEEGS